MNNASSPQSPRLSTSALPQVTIDIREIVADESFNIRGTMDEDRVMSLSHDIEQRGMLQPMVVRELKEFQLSESPHKVEKLQICDECDQEFDPVFGRCFNAFHEQKKKYFLLSGFRRRRALLKILERNKEFSPMVRATLVEPKTLEEAEDINTAENLDREAVRRYDLCKRFYTQHTRNGTSQREIANNLNISRPTVNSCIKVFAALSPTVKEKWSKCPRPEDEPPFTFLVEISTKSYAEQDADFSMWLGENVGEEIDYNKGGKRKVRNYMRGRAIVEGKVKQYAEGTPEWRTLMWVLGRRQDI